MYDKKGTFIKIYKVDKGVYVLNTKPCTNVLIKYIIRTSINLIIRVDLCSLLSGHLHQQGGGYILVFTVYM